ncbi:MAG: segregation and condensation protein B [Desulfitibacter sp. BRH_c19]|nr:MAG: segregation and condensation protein B [Desulfitibacter sp. BRH_c19]
MVLFFKNENKGILESLLFVATEPLTVSRMSQITEIEEQTVSELIKEIQDEYTEPHKGLMIEQVAGGYRIVTRPEYLPYIEKLYKPQVNPLSQAALETLAIIAYKHPVTKAEIESIRGVKADSVVGTLLERGLVEEVGRKDTPGRPILYGVTNKFLEYLGLNDLDQLPQIDGLPPLVS